MAIDLTGIGRALKAGHKVSTRKARIAVSRFHQPAPKEAVGPKRSLYSSPERKAEWRKGR